MNAAARDWCTTSHFWRRIGNVPAGVTVADPATVVPTNNPPPAVAGPVLDGTYRVDLEFAKQTVNGAQTTVGDNLTSWWAYRSLCTSTGCVATGSALDDNNHQGTTGAANVLRFADGRRQATPYLQPGRQCPQGNEKATTTMSWSWEPQPDGTFGGLETATAVTNECRNQGTGTEPRLWRRG
jgi:hypothetical protein